MDLSSREGKLEQGRRIQAAAEQAGWSLADLAKRLGCSRALIYQYVSGQVLAQPDRLQSIAELCGRSLAWFYATEGEALPAAERDAELDRLRREFEAEQLTFERQRGRELVTHLEALAVALGSPPDFAALRRTCERLLERAEELGDGALAADAAMRLGNACYALGDFEATRAAMTRAAAGFRQLGQERREVAARQTLGGALAALGERDRALAEFDAVVAGGAFADQWRGRLGRADVFEALGQGEAALEELGAAERSIAEQPDSAERRWAELYVAAATVNVYLLHDDFAAAEEVARRCEPLAEELACVSQHIEARLNLGAARRRLGHWAAALESFDDAVRLARLTGDRERAAVALACRADLLAALGAGERARAEGKDALAASLGLGSVRGEVLAHLALSEAYRRSGDGQEAWYHARQAIAAAAGHGLAKFEALARVAAARARRWLGDGAAAAAEARRAASAAESCGARWIQGAAAAELAALALAAGELAEAAEQAEQAARWAAETGEWELACEAQATEAARLRAAGDPAATAAALAVVERLLAQGEALRAAGVDEGLLEDKARLTVVQGCLTLLTDEGDHDTARRLLEAAAWPPLVAWMAARNEE